MAEAKGIKETKEAAIALIMVGKAVAKLMKEAKADGKIDWADLPKVMALFQDEKLMEVVKAGMEKIEEAPGEIADISIAELLELTKDVMPELMSALAEMKA